MNEDHLIRCSSPQWAAYLADDLLPWVLADCDLGDSFVPIDPHTLTGRLNRSGFSDAKIDVRGDRIAFTARADS